MSFFTVSSLLDALRVPSTKVPIDVLIFVTYVIPPVACYVVVAVLAVTPQTRAIRVALWPVVAFLAFRAAVSVDISLGNPDQRILNVNFVRAMFSISINTLSWTLAKKPLARYLRPANSSPSRIMDALDLASNVRGYGWNWSRGLYVPHETRPTNRVAFAFYVLLSGISHVVMCGVLYRAIHMFTIGAGSNVSTIFDETLPFFARYLRAAIISNLTGLVAYSGLQTSYDVFTVAGILLFRQDPAQWPPAFETPWCATSLNEFWGRRWHQFYRHTFLLGARPFSIVLGRTGGIIGAFLMSAILHHTMMATFDSRAEFWRMFVGFEMMGLGILVERTFYKVTGKRVGGVVGWIWMMAWLHLWGSLIVDGFVRVGMFTPVSAMHGMLPEWVWIDSLVTGFDVWLHTI